MSRAFILAPPAALTFAPAVVNSTVKYSKTDFQQILRTVLETRPPAPTPQLLVFSDGPYKKPLKARFSELYRGKTHIECYNFIQ